LIMLNVSALNIHETGRAFHPAGTGSGSVTDFTESSY